MKRKSVELYFKRLNVRVISFNFQNRVALVVIIIVDQRKNPDIELFRTTDTLIKSIQKWRL